MKKKGFTIVELLSVIVVIAIIILIAIPAYSSISLKFKEKSIQREVDLIKVAAEKYATDYNITSLYVKDLVDNGYIEPNNDNSISNPTDSKDVWDCKIVSLIEEKKSTYAKFDYKSNSYYEEDTKCSKNKLNELNQNLIINISTIDGEKITEETNYWSNKKIKLELEFKNKNYSLDGANITWYQTNKQKVILYRKVNRS